MDIPIAYLGRYTISVTKKTSQKKEREKTCLDVPRIERGAACKCRCTQWRCKTDIIPLNHTPYRDCHVPFSCHVQLYPLFPPEDYSFSQDSMNCQHSILIACRDGERTGISTKGTSVTLALE